MAKCASVLCVFSTLLVFSRGFNLETEHYTRHGFPGETPAMFGFTVASHKERGQPWVLVGAPEAQTDQPGVDRGGAVYRCDPTRDDACAVIPFDTKGPINGSNGHTLEMKSRQWFGATLNSAGDDGPVVACAPRYASMSNYFNNERIDPVGTCYVAKNGFSSFTEFAPCRTKNWGYHRQGSCQAGFGAAISKDGERLFVGAPGSWYWQGQMYSINPDVILPFMPPRFKDYGEGQLYSQSLDNKPTVISTGESPQYYDDSYMGYSVAVGDFDGKQQGAAVGMPRGADLLGKVLLYSWDLQNLQNLTGEQLGAYFGYSLASSDVDGDGYTDLIVGAPLYTIPNNEKKYETGRIYVIYQNSQLGRFQKVHFRDGEMSKGRFGLSLASLGDINLDGFGDFVVGAPYDGKNEQGAVYIYHGSAEGVREKPSQVIKAEDIYQSLSTFGFSVSGGVDLDNNQYADLVVGAYDSNTAFLFRARPVIKMTASVLFGTDSKLISLDDKNCTLRNRQKVPCTVINYCLEYDGIGVDVDNDFDLQFILDTKKPNDPRLYFVDYEQQHKRNQTITLVRKQMHCNSMPVYIVPNVRDKLTPIEVEMKYKLKNTRTQGSVYGSARQTRNPRSHLEPILDQNEQNSRKDSINIQKNCGPDNVCIPDLILMATPNVHKYLLGSKERLVIDVIVQNMGEDAFEATYNLVLPSNVNYIKIERVDQSTSEIPVQCSPKIVENNLNVLKCDIGNPLPQERLVHFKVLLEPYHKKGMPPSYEFFMEANSTNPEISGSSVDNQQKISIDIWLETSLVITGTAHPPDLHYNTSLYQSTNISHEVDIGPQLVHQYLITNNGPSTIEEAEIFLLWPYETEADDGLMYLLEQPETTGNVMCELAEHVNDFNLQIDRKRKSYLDSSNAALEGGQYMGGGISRTVATSGMSGGSSGIVAGSGSRTLTEEQKRKIVEEESKIQAQGGDGSSIHIQRAQQAHATSGSSSTSYTYNKQSSQSGGNTFFQIGEPVTQQTVTQNVNVVNKPPSYTTSSYQSQQYGSTGQRYGGQRGQQTETRQNWSSSGQSGSRNVQTQSQSGTYVPTEAPRQTYVSSQSSSSQSGQVGVGSRYGETDTNQRGITSQGTYVNNQGAAGWQEVDRDYGSRQSYDNRNYQTSGQSADGSRQWTTTYREKPVETVYNKTYTSVWNTTQTGSGPAVIHHASRNTTSSKENDGNIRHTESSTEYYTVGAEGDYGSHDNNRIDGGYRGSQTSNQYGSRDQSSSQSEGRSSQRQGSTSTSREGDITYYVDQTGEGRTRYKAADASSQGGSTRYGAGSYTRGSARQYNLGDGRQYSSNYNYTWGGEGGDNYSGRHKWSTEETVNKDLINAGSQTFRLNQESSGSTAGNTFVGAVQQPVGLGAAAAGRGYRVNTWDLGTLDNQESTRGSSSQQEHPASYVQDTKDSQRKQSSSYSTQWSSSSYDNVPTERPSDHFRWDRGARGKRQINEDPTDINAIMLRNATKCPGLKCAVMRCIAGPLQTNHEIWISARYRVNAQTLKKLSFGRSVTLNSLMVARISKLPYLGTPLERTPQTQQAVSVLTPIDPPQPAEPVPLWVVVLSACAGAALLLLLIFALYKCGFFKRHRPSDAPERQPLNRNGYGHGDEQL